MVVVVVVGGGGGGGSGGGGGAAVVLFVVGAMVEVGVLWALAWVITCIVSYPWKPPKLRAVAIMHHIAPVTVRNEKRVATPKSPVSFKDTQVGLGCDTSLLKADLPSKNAALQ